MLHTLLINDVYLIKLFFSRKFNLFYFQTILERLKHGKRLCNHNVTDGDTCDSVHIHDLYLGAIK